MGNPVLANGVFAENHLRLMLRKRGSVELIFQPPYSPELNSREFCFWSVKAYFRQHEQFLIYFTELAIIHGLQTITPAIHCRFLKFKNHFFHSLTNPTQYRVQGCFGRVQIPDSGKINNGQQV